MTDHSNRVTQSNALAKKRRRQFLDDFSTSFGIDNRVKRQSKAAIAYDAFGEKQCRIWLKIADGSYRKWEQLVKISTKRTKKKHERSAKQKAKARRSNKQKRKAETRQRAVARQEAALRQVAQFTNPRNGKDKVNATVRGIDQEAELVALRKRLKKAQSQGDRASEFKSESLKLQIALLEAEIKSPKI